MTILMLAPGPNMSFGSAPSGATYVSNGQGLINASTAADDAYLQTAGCFVLAPFAGAGGFGFATLALLYAADTGSIFPGWTGYPQNFAASVFSDGANTGTWLKTTTGNGAGAWTQVSTVTISNIVAATAANVAAASASAAAAAASATSAAGVVGSLTRSMGTGAVTGTAATDTNTYIFPPLDADGVLGNIDLYCVTSGAGTIRFGLAQVNGDGTLTQIHDFGSSTVWGSTGVQTFSFGNYAALAGQRVFFRRTGTTSGKFAYIASGLSSGVIDTYAGDLNGASLAISTNTVNVPYTLRYQESIKVSSVKSRGERVAAETGADDLGMAKVSRTYFPTGLVPGTATSSTTAAFGPARAIPNSGSLDQVPFYAVGAGTFTLYIVFPTDSGFINGQVVRQGTIVTTGAGWTAFVAGTHYDPITVPRGTRVYIASVGVSFSYSVNGKGAYSFNLPARIGDAVAPTILTNIAVMMNAVVGGITITLQDMIRNAGERRRESTPLTQQLFPGTSTPTNWTLTGWTVSTGLQSPAAADWTKVALFGATYNPTRGAWRMDFTVNTASTALKFGLCAQQTYSGAVLVNLVTNALELYSWNGTSTAGTLLATVPITFATAMGTTTGRKYALEVRRSRHRLQARLIDKATGEVVTLFAHTTGIQGIRFKGPSGPIFVAGSGSAGDVTVARFDASIGVAKTARIAFLGTSITEGALNTDEDDRSWAEQVDDYRNNGDVINLSTQGVTAAQIAAMLPQILAPFTALQYVIVDLGANDGSQAAWRTAMTTIIAAIIAAGAQPVLCTVMPRAGYPTSAMSADVTGGYFGGGVYPWIDLSAAVSTDGTNWIAGYQLADGIHPTTLGTAAMFARSQIDAPYLFDGCYATALVD